MANDDHPGPWRWDEQADGSCVLRDAAGTAILNPIVASGAGGTLVFVLPSSPCVRALTEAAPEMEALLRRIRDEVLEPLGLRPDITDLLARIDAASKAGT